MSSRRAVSRDCSRASPGPPRKSHQCSSRRPCVGWTSSRLRAIRPRSIAGGAATFRNRPCLCTCSAMRRASPTGCAAWTAFRWWQPDNTKPSSTRTGSLSMPTRRRHRWRWRRPPFSDSVFLPGRSSLRSPTSSIAATRGWLPTFDWISTLPRARVRSSRRCCVDGILAPTVTSRPASPDAMELLVAESARATQPLLAEDERRRSVRTTISATSRLRSRLPPWKRRSAASAAGDRDKRITSLWEDGSVDD